VVILISGKIRGRELLFLIDILKSVLQAHPEVTFFLTLGGGYLLGKLRIGNFMLGAVTGTLLMGVLVGQLEVKISPEVKQCFFMLFLFSIGYRCGPQFFQGLKRDGLSQAAVAATVAVCALIIAYIVSIVFHYDAGTGSGLIAGSMTESATIGTAGDAIAGLPIPEDVRTEMANHVPVAFAVTYLIGVVGAAWFLAQIAPKIIGVDLAATCREYEKEMGGGSGRPPGIVSAYRDVEMRAYRVQSGGDAIGKPVRDILPGLRVFVERVRRGDAIIEADGDTVLREGDIAAISGRRERLVDGLGPQFSEVQDPQLLDVPAESVDVFVTGKEVVGRAMNELSEMPVARGIYLRRIIRNRTEIPILARTKLQSGDVVTIVGSEPHIEAAVKVLGRPDRPTEVTDMVFVSSGIVFGALIGIPAFMIGKIEIGLSLSVGVLLGGLVWGWLQSVRPFVGRIPGPTLWVFESIGLTGFVAVVGLAAGPDFVRGLQQSGITLVFAGILTVFVPNLIGVLVGHYVFRMHPGILLGVCAGSGTATPALAAVQEAAKSAVPTLGYGVAYAVGNVLLALWGTIIVALLH
jgi:putative transport protein